MIPADILCDHPEIARLVYSQCTILRADWGVAFDAIEYVAASDHFRPLETTEMIPEYVWEIDGTAMKVVSCKEKSLDQERNPGHFYL